MAGLELLSDQGFRIDGRRPSELRRIQCKMGVFRQADGSAYIEQGMTKVLATVYGPHEVYLSDKRVTMNSWLLSFLPGGGVGGKSDAWWPKSALDVFEASGFVKMVQFCVGNIRYCSIN